MSQHDLPWLGQGRQQPKKETSNMKLEKETIELLESALSGELDKINRRGGDYPAYHSVRAIAQRIGEIMHWNGQPECEQFKVIMDGCVAIRKEHQDWIDANEVVE